MNAIIVTRQASSENNPSTVWIFSPEINVHVFSEPYQRVIFTDGDTSMEVPVILPQSVNYELTPSAIRQHAAQAFCNLVVRSLEPISIPLALRCRNMAEKTRSFIKYEDLQSELHCILTSNAK